MSMANVAVDTTAGGTVLLNDNRARRGAFIKALKGNTDDVFLKFDNSATVLTSSVGWPLSAGESLIVMSDLGGSGYDAGFTIKAIAGSGTQNVRVHEL
jgi:hypothetical protein